MTVGPDAPTGKPDKKTEGCRVTLVRERAKLPPEVEAQLKAEQLNPDEWYGGGGLWTLPDTATLGYARPNGKVTLKMVWWRDQDGMLTINAISPKTGETVKGEIPGLYPAPGLQPVALALPHLGCWHITASLGATSVRLVVDAARSSAPD
ncbi:hypothetical protein AB0395_00155 [Streptosporangium sp. NPDC051023]|uniref:hypothetical protein n=1 Tax=Streptosporangium sp. NPDC051023 TaxID=3155410 RepID=UPI00344DD774